MARTAACATRFEGGGVGQFRPDTCIDAQTARGPDHDGPTLAYGGTARYLRLLCGVTVADWHDVCIRRLRAYRVEHANIHCAGKAIDLRG